MRAKVLLGCCGSLILCAVTPKNSVEAQVISRTVPVHVRIDCLAGQGVSFSLTPWVIEMNAGDSLTFNLDSGANVSQMQIIAKQGRPWPFRALPPYTSTKESSAGARALDPSVPPPSVPPKKHRFQYAVKAICDRGAAPADTVVIDPDIIIIR